MKMKTKNISNLVFLVFFFCLFIYFSMAECIASLNVNGVRDYRKRAEL